MYPAMKKKNIYLVYINVIVSIYVYMCENIQHICYLIYIYMCVCVCACVSDRCVFNFA